MRIRMITGSTPKYAPSPPQTPATLRSERLRVRRGRRGVRRGRGRRSDRSVGHGTQPAAHGTVSDRGATPAAPWRDPGPGQGRLPMVPAGAMDDHGPVATTVPPTSPSDAQPGSGPAAPARSLPPTELPPTELPSTQPPATRPPKLYRSSEGRVLGGVC